MSKFLKKRDRVRNQDLMKRTVAAQTKLQRLKAECATAEAEVVELRLEADELMYELREKYGLDETDMIDFSGKVIKRPKAVRQIDERVTRAKIDELLRENNETGIT